MLSSGVSFIEATDKNDLYAAIVGCAHLGGFDAVGKFYCDIPQVRSLIARIRSDERRALHVRWYIGILAAAIAVAVAFAAGRYGIGR
jgi:hypothetical protein